MTSTAKNRVPVMLYRQLLGWCRKYQEVPFNPLPPVTLEPPLVSASSLRRLCQMRAILSNNKINDHAASEFGGNRHHPAYYALYGETVSVSSGLITFPEITSASQLRAIIRSVYWLNNHSSDSTEDVTAEGRTKDQISLAFDALRSVNQLSSSELDSRQRKRDLTIKVRRRESSLPNAKFHVGQIVKQRRKGWRGAVVGWTVDEGKNEKKHKRLSSLTTKQYTLSAPNSETATESPKSRSIKYTILVDMNDSSLLHESKTVNLEAEEDLISVDNPHLQRIHNHLVKQYFDRFHRSHFVPNRLLSFTYPLDDYSSEFESENLPELAQASAAIVRDSLRIIESIISIISDHIGDDEEYDELALLSTLLIDLKRNTAAIEDTSDENEAAMLAIKWMYSFHVRVTAMQWARRVNKRVKPKIEYSLGQIVRHKLYGFRGVIVGFDEKPRIDVSNWDGLQGVEDASEKPFYHIRPDINDCTKAFGGPRDFRYCCEDNLEFISSYTGGPLELATDLNEAEWRWDPATASYTPSQELKFMFAEEDRDNLAFVVGKISDVMAEFLLQVRDGGESNDQTFSLDDLFVQLQKGADNLDDATLTQDLIKEIWKESSDRRLRRVLDKGVAALLEGKNATAMAIFNEILEQDATYHEAWNKLATVQWMLGHAAQSRGSAMQSLRHSGDSNFQALAGLGLADMEDGNFEEAAEKFQRCLEMNPWSMVSARLAVCLDKRDPEKSDR
mmetsp:Transcript_29739/g.67156  ORF Transcript_29739/g.67156 Transcript_29739/m.67156 type:complete len:730 (+) Transcript_29739:142-2331(+)